MLTISRKVGLPPQQPNFIVATQQPQVSNKQADAQISNEQVDAQSIPQVSKEMLPVHCQAWTCLSSTTHECTSPAKRFPLKTVNEKNYFLYTQSMTFILTENQWTLIKLKNTKNWSTKYQKINKQLMKTKKQTSALAD